MRQMLADRFVPSGSRWIDLSSGDPVRVHIAAAGPRRDQIAWNARCAVLSNLRHPLINPLIDYGLVGVDRTFEAYAVHTAVRAGGAAAEILLTHAARFLRAHDVVLTRPLADYVLRSVSHGPARRIRPVGVVLQRRAVFETIAEALDVARPGGPCAVAIAGDANSGLRTLRLAAARAARLQGYVPVAPIVLRTHPWVADGLMARHVCVIYGDVETEDGAGQQSTVASLLTRLGAASPRRHIVLSFGRHAAALAGPRVRMDPMGITAMTGMVFVDPEHGPSPHDLFDAARRADGRPGQFLEHLGAYVPMPSRSAGMAVHETAQPYVVTRSAAGTLEHPPLPGGVQHPPLPGGVQHPPLPGGVQHPPLPGGVQHPPPPGGAPVHARRTGDLLRRATERGEALARMGRHASAARVLSRAARVLSAGGDRHEAARCAVSLGWLALDRARTAEAIRAFEQARASCADDTWSVIATIGLGVAWTDDGRLVEAEAALRSSLFAAGSVGDRAVTAQAAAALGRCLYWQGRYDEAAAALRAGGDASGAPAARVMLTNARVHLAEGAIPAAVRTARHALDVAREAGEPRAVTSACRVLAAAVASAGDIESAAIHIRDGLRVAKAAHLPLAAVRLRLTWADLQPPSLDPSVARRVTARIVAAGARWPRLLRFHARAVRARAEGAALDADTRAFVQASGAVAIARACGAATVNPVADLEAFLGLGHTASDDRAAIERIVAELRIRLRAVSVLLVAAPPERRVLALCGRPWHGDPHVAWRALGSGLSVPPDASVEPCQSAEPLRYGGEIIGAIAARWTAGTMLDGARATALLRMGALAVAANVRAVLDRAVPESAAPAWEDLLGDSAPTRALREAIARAARAPFPVLIEGESGSGKELVARAIHRLGARRDRRFCAINCAALSDDLLEAELFGHARGAFTGAVSERPGLFEDADGGTLFLDEIAELSARAQAKLLRVLQDGEVRRVGENVSRRVDVRIVAATNRRLQQETAAGRFRPDLRFRLDVVRIDVPPLRDRASDVPLLASRFWSDAAGRVGSHATLSPDAIAALARYDWPGNVRELQNVIAWMAVQSPRRGRVGAAALPVHLAQATAPSGGTFEAARAEFERRFVKAALATADGQRGRAAEALGVTRQGLAKMLRRLGLDDR